MQVLIAFVIVSAFVSGFFPFKNVSKDELNLTAGVSDQVRVRERVKSFSEYKDSYMIKQTYDYSCGSAALAMLLTYHLGESLSERQVIQGLLKFGNKRSISERRAFSLLDFKSFVKVLGYKGVGYKATMDDLLKLDVPGIVPLSIFNYRHFVVLKGIYKNHVFVIDPWQGNMSFSLSEFKQKWNDNILFLIHPKGGEKELGALKLREEDLRFIDEKITREILFDHLPKESGVSEGQRIKDLTGVRQLSKP